MGSAADEQQQSEQGGQAVQSRGGGPANWGGSRTAGGQAGTELGHIP